MNDNDKLYFSYQVRYDDDRIENRIHKIQDNMASCEPHLAQLLKLDSIGVDLMSAGSAKQLRNQLELEIFRQLQVWVYSINFHS
jgi:hypothetical protein